MWLVEFLNKLLDILFCSVFVIVRKFLLWEPSIVR